MAAYTYPVVYLDNNDFKLEFSDLSSRIEKDREFLVNVDRKTFLDHLFDTFKTFSLCVKHSEFLKEREWRVIYNPSIKNSPHVKSSIESIADVPQQIYKMPLKNIPEQNLIGIEIPELVERIIIGPTDNQRVLKDSFIALLTEAFCDNASERIQYSGIPLRSR